MSEESTTRFNKKNFLPDFCQNSTVLRLILTAQLIAFMLFVIATSADHFSVWNWSNLGLLSLFVQWITLSIAATLCFLNKLIIRFNLPMYTGMIILICIIVISTSTMLVYSFPFLHSLLKDDHSLTISLLRNLTIGVIVTGFVMRYAYIQHLLSMQKQAELQARLQMIQSKIHPHFLFNTLNNIIRLIHVRPALAEQLVEDLAILLRASLSECTQRVPLSKEINLTERYLHLEKRRLEDRLTIIWDIPAYISAKILVPHLILQPLVENSIKHGIQTSCQQGVLKIKIRLKQSFLFIRIQNTIPCATTEKKSGCQIGLKSVSERLKTFYDIEGKMKIIQNKQYYIVHLRMPITT